MTDTTTLDDDAGLPSDGCPELVAERARSARRRRRPRTRRCKDREAAPDRLLLPLLLPICDRRGGVWCSTSRGCSSPATRTPRWSIGHRSSRWRSWSAPRSSPPRPQLRTSSLAMILGVRARDRRVAAGSALARARASTSGEGGRRRATSQPTGTAVGHGRRSRRWPSIKFNATEFTAPAGIVQINYSGATGHTLAIQDPKFDGFLLTTDAGGPKTGKVELTPGKYTIYCTVPGHEAAGHEGDAHRRRRDAPPPRRRAALGARRCVAGAAVRRVRRRRWRRQRQQAYERAEGPGDRDHHDRGRQLLLQARHDHGRRRGSPRSSSTAPGRASTTSCSTAQYPGFQLEADGGGGTQSKKIDLKPGKYTFYCNIPGHRAAGHGRHAHRQVASRRRGHHHRAARRRTGSSRAGSGPDVLAARPQLDRRGRRRAPRSSTVDAARTCAPAGWSTCVPRNTDGNVRRNSARDTGPTTHTSSRPSSRSPSGVIIIPLA